MPSFNVEVPHSMGQAVAQERMESFLDSMERKYKDQISDLSGSWTDNILNFSFSTFGIKIVGKMTVEQDKVLFDGELPFAAMMFKGKIASGIQEALEKALA